MDISRFLPINEYNAAIGANSPSASNVFATINDLAGISPGIYGGSGSLQVGDTTVTMAATDKLLFNSLNGPYDLFTIDATTNRIGIGIASPGHTLHMVSGNMFIQNGYAAIGTTTPSAGQMLKISAGDSQVTANLLQGVRIDLSPLATAGALNAWGIDVRHDDARSGSGTKQFFMYDANFLGSSASEGTHTNYGIRSRAVMTVGGTANVTNIAGYFEAANGTTNVAMQIVDGTQGAGKVLQSDANGRTTWVTPSSLSGVNGIYGGSGTVPTTTVATLTDTLAIGSGLLIRDNELAMNTTVTGGGAGLFVKGTGISFSAPIAEFYGINANNNFGKTVIGNNQYGATLAMYNEVGVEKIRLVSTTNNNSFIGGSLSIASTNLPQAQLEVTGMIRAMSTAAPALTTGKSIEFYFNSGSDQGRILAYDRDTAQYKDMVIGNGATPNKFTIFKSGNVGIGTEVDAGAKLSVRALSNGTDVAFVVKNNTESLDLFKMQGDGIGYLRNQLVLQSALGGTDTLIIGTQSVNRRGGILFNTFNGASSSAIYDRADGTFSNGLTLKSRNNIFEFIASNNSRNDAEIRVDKIANTRFISSIANWPLALQGSISPNDINDGIVLQTKNASGAGGSYLDRFKIQTQSANVNAFMYNINGLSVGTTANPTSMLTVNGDIETLGNTNGIIFADRTDGNRYRTYTDGGVLYTELVP